MTRKVSFEIAFCGGSKPPPYKTEAAGAHSVQRVILSEARKRVVEPVGRHEVSGAPCVQRVILSEARKRVVEPGGRHEVSGSRSIENIILELVWLIISNPK